MKIYSPSSTINFQRCPQYFVYQRQGWQTKVVGKPQVAMAVGLGIGYGMELIFKGVPTAKAIECAMVHSLVMVDTAIAGGAYLLPSVEKSYELIPKRVEKALRRFWKDGSLPNDWRDFRAELVFPDHGNCRVDLLHNSDLGPCITDFKTKVTAVDYIVDNFLFDAETSWQMYHYVWAAREMGLKVDSFAIVLIVIEPFKVYVEQFMVDEQVLERWVKDAHYWWKLMEIAEAFPEKAMRVGDCRTKYGLCDMHSACFGVARENMELLYQIRERK